MAERMTTLLSSLFCIAEKLLYDETPFVLKKLSLSTLCVKSVMVSVPLPLDRRNSSAPPLPVSVSLPPRPLMMSAPAPPTIVSAPDEPMILKSNAADGSERPAPPAEARWRRSLFRFRYRTGATSANIAPCGSIAWTIQLPPGTSIGPLRIWPPPALTRSTPASMAGTLK